MREKSKISLKRLHANGDALYKKLGVLQDQAMDIGMEQVARLVHSARRHISWHLATAREKAERRKRKLAKLRTKPATNRRKG